MSFRAEIAGKVDLFDLHAHDPAAYPFLLQSVAGHPVSGRYDILFAFPQKSFTGEVSGDFFADLSREFADEPKTPATDLPFCGGWFVYLGYEAAQQIEPTLKLPPSPYRLPDALAVRCPAAAIFDRQRQVTQLVAEHSSQQLNRLRDDLLHYINNEPQDIDKINVLSINVDAPSVFLQGVSRVHEYLAAGDSFQINLSRGWRAKLDAESSYQTIYRQLREQNPAPFAGLASWKGTVLLSSSPERLVSVDHGVVETRPIAGTRARGDEHSIDAALQRELTDSIKERAEHIMLIDLERNDLGRICEPGSIEVSELMTIESYAHVHHIVSNVRGRLRAGKGPGEVLKAVFPGGTITGCPKVRSMEIIAELEGVGRGPYTGAMGYLSRCGRLDTNILIRTLICEDGVASFRAGAGIVSDSVAAAELAETEAKARGLLLALGAAA